jgi:hypothetical protein
MPSHPTRLTFLIMATLALAATSPLGAGEKLTMRVAPNIAIEPATVVIDAVAERDPATRLCVGAWAISGSRPRISVDVGSAGCVGVLGSAHARATTRRLQMVSKPPRSG